MAVAMGFLHRPQWRWREGRTIEKPVGPLLTGRVDGGMRRAGALPQSARLRCSPWHRGTEFPRHPPGGGQRGSGEAREADTSVSSGDDTDAAASPLYNALGRLVSIGTVAIRSPAARRWIPEWAKGYGRAALADLETAGSVRVSKITGLRGRKENTIGGESGTPPT